MIDAALISLSATYALWVFYLAVMALKRASDAGQLSPLAYALGLPVLKVGLVLDVLVNLVVMTVVLLELPREWLVTTRLKRHNKDADGWRKRLVAVVFEPLLDPFDPSGDHI